MYDQHSLGLVRRILSMGWELWDTSYKGLRSNCAYSKIFSSAAVCRAASTTQADFSVTPEGLTCYGEVRTMNANSWTGGCSTHERF